MFSLEVEVGDTLPLLHIIAPHLIAVLLLRSLLASPLLYTTVQGPLVELAATLFGTLTSRSGDVFSPAAGVHRHLDACKQSASPESRQSASVHRAHAGHSFVASGGFGGVRGCWNTH